MSPRRVLAEHSSRDLSDWRAFDLAGGLPDPWRDDYRFGVIAAQGMEVSDPEEGKRPARPSDFFPHLDPPTSDTEDAGEEDAEGDLDESEKATEALKNYYAFWALTKQSQRAMEKAEESGQAPKNPKDN